MQRRNFVTSVLVGGLVAPVIGDGHSEDDQHGDHDHGKGNDKSTNYTISFGHWNPTPTNTPTQTSSPIDRFAPEPPDGPGANPRFLNGHDILPKNLQIQVGDTVTFAISGFHLVVIYRGIKAKDVDRTKLIPAAAPFPPLLDDPSNRLYRGLDPRVLNPNQDRVEVVGFNTRGRYLVACGVLPHFYDPVTQEFIMVGYIDVRN